MLVRRSTMDAAVEAERERGINAVSSLASAFGKALQQTNALQEQLSAWVMNKAENITPEQMADMFYAQDDRWQAAFFNSLQDRIQAHHDALPPTRPGGWNITPGVPAGEGQWWHMAKHLDRSGFETIEAMFVHAKHAREREQSA